MSYTVLLFEKQSTQAIWQLPPVPEEFASGFYHGFIACVPHYQDTLRLTMTNYRDEWISDASIPETEAVRVMPLETMDWQYTQYIGPDAYGWWLYDGQRFDLVIFKTAYFIQGFMTACKYMNRDFRDFIMGPPFKPNFQELSQPVYYAIQGWDINIPKPLHIPLEPQAFYVEVHEADPYGQDYE